MKNYQSPQSKVFELEINSMLATSSIEIGGEAGHLDAPHKGSGSENWEDGVSDYWEGK